MNLYVKLKCLDTPLRFAVGTRVECHYDGNEDSGDDDSDSIISLGGLFDSSDSGSDYSDSDTECEWTNAVSGVVIKHHYRHPNLPTGFWAPYQVQLDSGYTIHAPLDTNVLVLKVELGEGISAHLLNWHLIEHLYLGVAQHC